MYLLKRYPFPAPHSFHVSLTHGFCPSTPALNTPSPALAPHFCALSTPSTISQELISSLPPVSPTYFTSMSPEDLELSCLIYSMLTSHYYWARDVPTTEIPENISIPFIQISKLLKRPPISTLVSLQFYNWRLIDPTGPFIPDNLSSIFTFSGTRDEECFYNCANYVEAAGASAIQGVKGVYLNLSRPDLLSRYLSQIKLSIKSMRKALTTVFSLVDPEVFYFGFRKKLGSFQGVIFQGGSEDPLHLSGPSAAQSPLIKFLDSALGIEHSDKMMLAMTNYLHSDHRKFIECVTLARKGDLRGTMKSNKVSYEWNEVINELVKFRILHYKLIENYVIAHSNVGTGGSHITEFIDESIVTTKKALI